MVKPPTAEVMFDEVLDTDVAKPVALRQFFKWDFFAAEQLSDNLSISYVAGRFAQPIDLG